MRKREAVKPGGWGALAAALGLIGVVACGGSGQREFPRDFNEPVSDALTECTDAGLLEGVDVSEYDATVDWRTAHDAGVMFAFARVSDGLNFPDPYFDSNWSKMRDAGVIRGSYQYFEPDQDPHEQAALVLQHIPDFGPGDLPPVIDVETLDGLDAGTAAAAVSAWVADIQAGLGRRPLIYTSARVWTLFDNPPLAADLWVVNWQVNCPAVPPTWAAPGWIFWQYNSTGTVPGLTAEPADLDRFNGSLAELKLYALGDAGVDGGLADAGALDAGLNDGGLADAGALDAGSNDAGSLDGGEPDAGVNSQPDAGVNSGDAPAAGGCSGGGSSWPCCAAALGWLALRRKSTLRAPHLPC